MLHTRQCVVRRSVLDPMLTADAVQSIAVHRVHVQFHRDVVDKLQVQRRRLRHCVQRQADVLEDVQVRSAVLYTNSTCTF